MRIAQNVWLSCVFSAMCCFVVFFAYSEEETVTIDVEMDLFAVADTDEAIVADEAADTDEATDTNVLRETVAVVDTLENQALAALESAADLVQAHDRIEVLEQLLADRDAIILQLSSEVPALGSDTNRVADGEPIEALLEANRQLQRELENVILERDQIREDFNRLFEEGSFAQPAKDPAASAHEAAQSQRIADLENQLGQLTAHLAEVVGERNRLSEELEAAATGEEADNVAASQRRVQELTEELAVAEETRQALEVRLGQQSEVLSDDALMQELESLRALDASRRVTMDDLMLQLGALRDTVSQRDDQVSVASERIAILEEELQLRQQDLQEGEGLVGVLRDQISGLERRVGTMQNDIDVQFATMNTLQDQLAEKDRLLADQIAAYQELDTNKAQIAGALAEADTHIARLEQDLAELRSTGKELRSNVELLTKDIEQTRQVDERRRRVLDETLVKLAATEEREAVLLAQKAELESQLAGLTELRDAQQEQIHSLQAEQATLQGEVDVANQTIGDLRVELADREQIIADQSQEFATLQAAHADVQGALEQARSAAQQYQTELGVVREDLTESERVLAALRGEMENTLLVDDRRRRTLDETLAKLALSEQRESELAAELQQVSGQLDLAAEGQATALADLEARNRLLEEELAKMEQDFARVAQSQPAIVSAEPAAAVLPEADAARLLELEVRNAELEGQLVQLQASATGVNQEIVDVAATVELERLQEALAQSQRDVARLQEALLEQTNAMVASGGDGSQMEALLQQMREQEAAANAQLDAMARDLAQAKADLDQMALLAPTTPSGEVDTTQVAALQQELAEVKQELDRVLAESVAVAAPRTDIRESDLYRELEQNAAILRESLTETESERQRLAGVLESLRSELEAVQGRLGDTEAQQVALQGDLDAAAAREVEYKELLERVMPELRELEGEVTRLRQEREALANRLLQREDDIAALQVELEQREHRLARAEQVADVLEQTRTEVDQAQRRQRLNMHYNMASVYARDGRFQEAEYEYLQALRLDPSDADVHYNLGILYEEELKLQEKALLHYRRYLQLKPNGTDADRVRSWIMRLEMK